MLVNSSRKLRGLGADQGREGAAVRGSGEALRPRLTSPSRSCSWPSPCTSSSLLAPGPGSLVLRLGAAHAHGDMRDLEHLLCPGHRASWRCVAICDLIELPHSGRGGDDRVAGLADPTFGDNSTPVMEQNSETLSSRGITQRRLTPRTVPHPPRLGDLAPGGAYSEVAARRLHSWRHEHRQQVDGGRDH